MVCHRRRAYLPMFYCILSNCLPFYFPPEHFDEVFACVEKDSKENATTVTWTIALYLQMNNKNVYCDLVYRQNQSLSSASLMYQAPSGNLNLPGLQMAAQYIIQMICFAKAPNGSRSTHKSSEVSFIAGKRQ